MLLRTSLAYSLLAANNILLDWKDMPTFEPGVVDEFSPDELGKFVQRAASVDKLAQLCTSIMPVLVVYR